MKVAIRTVPLTKNSRSDRTTFWSAGRQWSKEPTIVDVVKNDPIPREFLRPVIVDGFFVVDPDHVPKGHSIPKIPCHGRDAVRAYVKDGVFLARYQGKEYQIKLELDFPSKDMEYQKWCVARRNEHRMLGEITHAELQQILSDRAFLIVETPQLWTAPESKQTPVGEI